MIDVSPAAFGLKVPDLFLLLDKWGDPACIFEKNGQDWKQYNIVSGQLVEVDLWMNPDKDFAAIHGNTMILDEISNWKSEYEENAADPAFWVECY